MSNVSRVLDKFQYIVDSINTEFNSLQYLSNDELRIKLCQIEIAINGYEDKGKGLNEFLAPVFAIVKETARRFSEGNIVVTANSNDVKLATMYDFVEIIGDKAIYKSHWDVMGVPNIWKMIHYDEQLLAGIFLHYGYATEMATGEGKTLVATLPVFLNALTHEGVHLMTVNEYLSKRDYETTRPIYMFYGLTTDCIEKYPRYDKRHKDAYKLDIVFGTNSTFTFDYLWDHVAITPQECVQTAHNYAIIDELDSILIDDADEPHIVGGGNYYNNGKIYKENLPLIKELLDYKCLEELFKFDKLRKYAEFTKEGKEWLSVKKEIPDLYSIERTYELVDFDDLAQEKQDQVRQKLYLQNVFLQLLLALTVYERDVDYIVEGGRVKIIDSHTGRVKESSRWEFGLHTAMEVKEEVEVQNDFDGMGVISLKNYFQLYNKVAGMSGTIMSVEDELFEIYNLKCASIPTHKPLIRQDKPLRIFKNIEDKDNAIIKAIINNQNSGRPTLVGSISVKRSEEICNKLHKQNIEYNKLDAKTLKDEALTISKAGLANTITVSTSVAGRGTDIKPSEDAIIAGGLMVIGTDLFESVRIDRQLKGRSGRQGDPGTSVFFVSLEDQILKNLETEDLQSLEKSTSLLPEGEIFDEGIKYFFEKAQANREKYLKNCRKETARKDDIIAPHRKRFYEQRNAVLFNAEAANSIVREFVTDSIYTIESVDKHLFTLYLKTKELIVRSTKNNPNRTSVLVPFSDKLHPFAILLEVELAMVSFDYFCKEFKRQIILHIYDKQWKKFVLHMMGNLDRKEIEMLDGKYLKMMKDIGAIILSRLLQSSIPFELRNEFIKQDQTLRDNPKHPKSQRSSIIIAENPCPCGSGKKYCECHGSNIRNSRVRIRR